MIESLIDFVDLKFGTLVSQTVNLVILPFSCIVCYSSMKDILVHSKALIQDYISKEFEALPHRSFF